MTTVTCFCTSPYQDKAYGKDQRVWTPVNKSDARSKRFTKVRCTVCGREWDAPKGSQPKDDKEAKKTMKVEVATTKSSKAEPKDKKKENKATKRK